MRKILTATALAVATVALTAGVASADDNTGSAPYSSAPVVAVVNGPVSVADRACVAPWHWDGPIQVLTDNGAYQACQDPGGVQSDAPGIDLSSGPAPLPLPISQG